MQKALTQMNLQLANVISDLSGLTGQKIVRAIVAGQRDPYKLAELRDPRIQASPEHIAKSLEGNWRPELVFVLKQEVDMYDTYQQRIAECDQQLQKHLTLFADTVPLQAKEETKKKKGKPSKNTPSFPLSGELQRITGVDLTRIDGIDVMVAQTLVSEVGLDMSRWKTEAHFASWLGLCPDNRISGDKVLSRARGTWSTALLPHCGSRPRPCCEARLTSARSTDACAPSSVPRKLSRPWHTASPDSSIEC
jgi:transposase